MVIISNDPRHRHTNWRCDRGDSIRPGLQEQQVRQGATLHVSEVCGFRPWTVINLTVPGSGSIKANIGHLEGGSGLAAILKSIMILETGTIPPQALFEKLNPKIKAKFYHLEVRGPQWHLCRCFEPRLTEPRCQPLASLGQHTAYDGSRSIRSALAGQTVISSSMMLSTPLRLSGLQEIFAPWPPPVFPAVGTRN